jgi:CubicO group peptidase (beta-lactamase class C family)
MDRYRPKETGLMKLPTEQIRELFSPWDDPRSPGCALGIFMNGGIALQAGFGMASLEHDAAITPDTVFRIASTSKQFTAACLLALADRGTVTLDDEIRRWLPEMPGYSSVITLRHLLHHISGVRDYLALIHLPGMEPRDWDDEKRVLGLLSRQQALNFPPGEHHMYSNSGYFLLGLAMERAGGQTLREMADELIFSPLGMQSTHFHDNHREVVHHRAQGYSLVEANEFELDMTTSEIVGDGGAFTTLGDMFRWYRGLRDDTIDGGNGFTPRMIATGYLNNGRPILYAAGLYSSNYRGLRLISHPGAYAGFRSEMLWFPDPDVCVVCLANLSDVPAASLARRVADLCLGDRLTGEAIADAAVIAPFVDLPTSLLSGRTGVYRNLVTGNIWELSAEDGRLMAEEVGGESHELLPAGPDRFVALSAPVELDFRFNDEEETLDLTVRAAVELPADREYTLKEVEPSDPDADNLAGCAGAYHSQELDLTWELVLRNGRLHLDVPGMSNAPLRPLIRELFRLEEMTLDFCRDASGRVASLLVTTNRLRNIEFHRQ